MNLIDFFCNFGGLLGMWLGLSLFDIFNNILNLIMKIAQQKYECLDMNELFDKLTIKYKDLGGNNMVWINLFAKTSVTNM